MAGERTRCYSTRPRRVPPEFCTDELLESCSVLATLLLYRLISQADDQGRLPGHPRYIKGVCFPMRADVTERKVEAALAELSSAGFILRYDLRNRDFIQLEKWFDLQGKWGQRRTYESRYPAPPGWTGDWVNAGPAAEEVRAPVAQDAGDVRPPSPSASPTPFPRTFTGQGKPPARSGGLDRVGDLMEKARRGGLSDEEALQLGALIANPSPSGRTAS